MAKEWATKGIKWVTFCNQGFDASSVDIVAVKAFRLDTRAAVELYSKAEKLRPPPVEVLEVTPVPNKPSITEPTAEAFVDDSVDAPSLTALAASEANGKKEERACSCVVS